jgi:hypothetical protein
VCISKIDKAGGRELVGVFFLVEGKGKKGRNLKEKMSTRARLANRRVRLQGRKVQRVVHVQGGGSFLVLPLLLNGATKVQNNVITTTIFDVHFNTL